MEKSEKTEKTVLDRNLEQKHFEDAAKAIKNGKEDGDLTNVELVKNLVESYKGKTLQAPIEVIITSAIFLNARELMGIIETLKCYLRMKVTEELKEMAGKGGVTAEDAMATLMLAAIMKKESEKD